MEPVYHEAIVEKVEREPPFIRVHASFLEGGTQAVHSKHNHFSFLIPSLGDHPRVGSYLHWKVESKSED
jgi:hypothetical protein